MSEHKHDDSHAPEEKKPETAKVEVKAEPKPLVEEMAGKLKEGVKSGFVQSLKSSLDEAAFFAGGFASSFLINYLSGRGRYPQAKVVEQAQKLYAEGKHEEANQLIIKGNPFGIGHGDEAGMLAVQAYVVQFFLDANEETQLESFLDALDALDDETQERLRLVLTKIETVEQRGKILISLARTPGDLTARIGQHFRQAGIIEDPANHPLAVLVNEVGAALNTVGNGYREQVDNKKADIRARQAERAQRLAAARARIAREGR